ncbi:hypothetical protein CN507_25625 [Bacillus cereus]|nr:hypothetical protein CN507_25625 [Bacillus cereus]
MYKHTLCFINRNEEILMLNRVYDPVKGLWNGVGEMIPKFLTEVLYNELILEHSFVLSNHKLVEYKNKELAKQSSPIDSIHKLV